MGRDWHAIERFSRISRAIGSDCETANGLIMKTWRCERGGTATPETQRRAILRSITPTNALARGGFSAVHERSFGIRIREGK